MKNKPNISRTRNIIRILGGALLAIFLIVFPFVGSEYIGTQPADIDKMSKDLSVLLFYLTSPLPSGIDGILLFFMRALIILLLIILSFGYVFSIALSRANLGGPGLDIANREISQWLKTRKKKKKDKTESNSQIP
jgi:hypothetical protein